MGQWQAPRDNDTGDTLTDLAAEGGEGRRRVGDGGRWRGGDRGGAGQRHEIGALHKAGTHCERLDELVLQKARVGQMHGLLVCAAPVSWRQDEMEKQQHQDETSTGPTDLAGESTRADAVEMTTATELELDLRLLEALEIYPPKRLQGVHGHFLLFGLIDFLHRRLNRKLMAEDILQQLEKFYCLEKLVRDLIY
ncbi:hypothetical protein CBR_g4585 [Chara braunii]|uniref:Uncharacterized protein n=1 Tax=Chara braunii TaxID=69332 RepID=A0A388KI74_CHABU|nr:hypothetical protein CBR_g4585 [Chara braunii]|eukprot:GBG69754.1 hypothetical protein CBR_g4585 [Chara braunii]